MRCGCTWPNCRGHSDKELLTMLGLPPAWTTKEVYGPVLAQLLDYGVIECTRFLSRWAYYIRSDVAFITAEEMVRATLCEDLLRANSDHTTMNLTDMCGMDNFRELMLEKVLEDTLIPYHLLKKS